MTPLTAPISAHRPPIAVPQLVRRLAGLVALLFALLAGQPDPGSLALAAPIASVTDDSELPAELEQVLEEMPVVFIENDGQLDPRVGFYVHAADKSLYFTRGGVTFLLSGNLAGDDPATTEHWTVKLDFVGADPDVAPVGGELTEGVVSYFRGTPDDWTTGVHTYRKLVYHDLWPGIDLVYSGTVQRLKYEFVVAQGADPSQIRLAYRGAESVSLDEAGQLHVVTPVAGFQDDVPISYQNLDTGRAAVATAYSLPVDGPDGSREYGFELGSYDTSRPLVIDPAVFVYSGYIGGAGSELGRGIAVDASGNAYVVGSSASTLASFPADTGSVDPCPEDPTCLPNDHNGTSATYDAFVAKVKSDGSGLAYFSFIGGTSAEQGERVALDHEGNAYVVGATSSDAATPTNPTGFPATVGPFLSRSVGYEMFVCKVNPAGDALVYCGYTGVGLNWSSVVINSGINADIAVDGAGNAFLVGGRSAGHLLKVTPSGTAIAYHVVLNGTGSQEIFGVAVDPEESNGRPVIVGATTSGSLGAYAPVGGPDLTYNGSYDVFAGRVNASGTAFEYLGYIGGAAVDRAEDVALDETGNAYITGSTCSEDFPATPDAFDGTYNGQAGVTSISCRDAYVAKVGTAGTLEYATYLGGADSDIGYGIAVDAEGRVVVVGAGSSEGPDENDFPVRDFPDTSSNGGFVTRLRPGATDPLDYSGFVDSNYGAFALAAVAVDPAGDVYMVGNTGNTSRFPRRLGPDLSPNGGNDAFVTKLTDAPGPCRPEGIAAWWTGDGDSATDPNAWDAAGGNRGFREGSASFAGGVVGNALSFDGANAAHFRVDNNLSHEHVDFTGDFTIDAWLRPRRAADGSQTVGILDKAGVPRFVLTPGPTGLARLRLGAETSAGTIPLNAGFSHVAVTVSGNDLKLYIDGQLDSTHVAPSITENNREILIGDTTNSGNYQGEIDELAVHTRALSAQEIGGIYSAGASGNGRCYNRPPAAVISGFYIVSEGVAVTFDGSASSDPDTDDYVALYEWDFDYDGTTFTVDATGATLDHAGHVYDDGTSFHTVALRVTDSRGAQSTIATATVDVVNAAPTATLVAPISVQEVSAIALALTDASDRSNADTVAGFTYAFDCGDGFGYGAFGATSTASCPTSDDGLRTVRGKVRDKDGGETAYSALVAVLNVAPVIAAVANEGPIDEGQSVAVHVIASDVAGAADPLAYAFDCDNDGTSEVGPQPGADASCPFADNGTFLVGVRVSDGDGGEAAGTTAVVVRNVAPTVTSLSLPLDPQVVNTSVSGNASFTDPGVLDSHTAVWTWGDGGTSAGSVSESGGSGTIGGSHSYATPGIYTVSVAVTDKDGGSGEATFQYYVVVYDPDGGFVTGGGWFNSPGGAYAPAPTVSGKATFGFMAKYLSGRTVPDGNTEFQLKSANLSFKSVGSYEWLTVAGARAQFRGEGTINGSGDYDFFITATDGQQPGGGGMDKLRIRIWNRDGGGLVYDNQMNAPDDADPTTVIGGGSIVIHKP